MAKTKEKKSNKFLSEKELQKIIDNDFQMSSDEDEEENAQHDEFETSSGKLHSFFDQHFFRKSGNKNFNTYF